MPLIKDKPKNNDNLDLYYTAATTESSSSPNTRTRGGTNGSGAKLTKTSASASTSSSAAANKGAAARSQRIVIQAQSASFNSGNMAVIKLNNEQIEVEKNENNHHRGLHMVVLDPASGKVELAKSFDTYQSSEELDKVIP